MRTNQLEPSRTARHDARNALANDTPTTQGPKIEDDPRQRQPPFYAVLGNKTCRARHWQRTLDYPRKWCAETKHNRAKRSLTGVFALPRALTLTITNANPLTRPNTAKPSSQPTPIQSEAVITALPSIRTDIKSRPPEMPQHAIPRLPKRADEASKQSPEVHPATDSLPLKIERKSQPKGNHRLCV
ncbi:hypothetical protein FNV43_RR20971 [Rhamnella rubrinervis]|uniref:Uncharacterized protein n=1 Tax=Rhamnella rubrinervis TaxID=2594499 RepID=A0A8K0E0T4_9ROSA|nr:hypothetical protein FNV43_RR20971 [Rhamnella rubrinervis]